MMAVAASNPISNANPHRQALRVQYASRRYAKPPICKPRANYLKPKEIRKLKIIGFDLQHRPNYLKVGIKGRKHRAGVLHHDPRFRDQGRRTAGRPWR